MNFYIVLPEIFAFISGILLILCGAYRKSLSFLNINIFTIFLLSIILGILIFTNTIGSTFNDSFVNNKFIINVKFFIIVLAIILIYISINYLKLNSLNYPEYQILFIFSLLGMMIMLSANDFILLYISIELQSLSLYVLVALKRESVKSSEAALKYFILGSIASAIILYGCSMIYSVTGSTNFSDIKTLTIDENTYMVFSFGLVLVLSGMAFKLSAAPFHMWTPDVYEGSPSSVTAILITLPKLAALTVLIKLLYEPFSQHSSIWQQIIPIISVCSMALGAISALRQENLKRLFAFSTIANIGYVMIGIVCASEDGIAASLLYLVIYSIGALGIFAFIMLLRRDDTQLTNLASISGMSKNNPVISLSVVVLLLSMAGIPPFGGFFAKFYIFISAVESGFLYLAIIGVVFSVISAFYYLKIIKIMYFEEMSEPIDKNIDRRLLFIVFITAALMLFFIFYADDFIAYIFNLKIIS
tara:strand:- start:1825 stop:3243 length:1419 start_codon:yes stop_codon:yes gene_type:complete